MKDLIERLEAAMGPDEALDRDIWCRVMKLPLDALTWCPGIKRWAFKGIDDEGVGFWDFCPPYTNSLDAVHTLTPKGSMVSMVGGNGGWAVAIAPDEVGFENADWTPHKLKHIALCIAALKERKP
jgi:hypothetical protein